MKFRVRKTILHGNNKLYIYVPLEIPKQLTAIDPIVWDKAILGNSTAYEFLKKIFILASSLEFQKLIYIPTNPIKLNEYRDIWEYGIFDMDIVLINYHGAQLKAKEIFKAIKEANTISEELKDITIEETHIQYPNHWLTDRKLTTKRFKNLLIISTNRDVFLKLACDASGMTGMEDDKEYNFDYHIHEDFIGTSKDNGFNFLYYHKKENM
ncbi:hypothetical protein [Clostridium sp. Marseille-QA1073]